MIAAKTSVANSAAPRPALPAEALAELVVSPDGRIVECGPSAARLLGLADQGEAAGVHLSLFCRDAERLADALSAAAVTGRLERWDADLVCLDGSALPAVVDLVASFDEPRALNSVRVTIKPVQAWAAAADEPVRPRNGRDLAGQLSHELNNLLAIISGHSEVLLATPPNTRVDASSVDAIQRAVSAAAQVAARVRTLGRRAETSARGVDIDSLLSAVQADLRRTFGHRLAVAVQPAPHPWTVAVDRAVVEHGLAAIAADAIDAMPHGGTLTFRTMNVEVGRRRPGATMSVRPGRYVRVEVTYLTAGVPMPTRPARRESDAPGPAGLDALRQAGARVIFDSDGIRVASVAVLLPSDGVTVLRPRATVTPATTSASLLLMEQDVTLQRLLQTVLKGHGYRVTTASYPGRSGRGDCHSRRGPDRDRSRAGGWPARRQPVAGRVSLTARARHVGTREPRPGARGHQPPRGRRGAAAGRRPGGRGRARAARGAGRHACRIAPGRRAAPRDAVQARP